jgi:predicted RNA binding protein YcfA (HicA-like mRNA interferase family)
MRLPRDISGMELASKLTVYGYFISRQSGSHIRLTTHFPKEHHITIPQHDPLKIGTLNAILNSIAGHLQKTKDQIVQEIF